MAVPYLGNGKNINLDSAGVYSKAKVDSLIEAATPDTTAYIATHHMLDSVSVLKLKITDTVSTITTAHKLDSVSVLKVKYADTVSTITTTHKLDSLSSRIEPWGSITLYDDFLQASGFTNSLTSSLYWSGLQIDWYTGTARTYGVVGVSVVIGAATSYKFMRLATDTSNGSSAPGLVLSTPNIDSRMRLVRVAGNGSTRYTYAGWFTTIPGSSTRNYGAWVQTTGNGNLQCITKNSSGADTTTSSVAMTTDVFHTARIATNATGTAVLFYIDDVLVATHSTYLTTAGLRFYLGHSYGLSAGQTSDQLFMDYFYLKITGLSR